MDPITKCGAAGRSLPGPVTFEPPAVALAKSPELQRAGSSLGDVVCHRTPPSLTTASTQPIAAAFFPTVVGQKQVYRAIISRTMDPGEIYEGTYSLAVEKVSRQPGEVAVEVRTHDSYTGRYRFGTLRMGEDRVLLEDLTYFGVGERYVPGLSTEFLRLPLRVGARWDDGHWIGHVRQKTRIQTPLGERDAWRVYVIGVHEQAYTAVGSYWISPGLGVVKAELSIPGWDLAFELDSVEIPDDK